MDGTSLFISLMAGLIGMAMITIARRTGRLVPFGAGVGLIALPYFIANVVILLLVCGTLTALPFVWRDA